MVEFWQGMSLQCCAQSHWDVKDGPERKGYVIQTVEDDGIPPGYTLGGRGVGEQKFASNIGRSSSSVAQVEKVGFI